MPQNHQNLENGLGPNPAKTHARTPTGLGQIDMCICLLIYIYMHIHIQIHLHMHIHKYIYININWRPWFLINKDPHFCRHNPHIFTLTNNRGHEKLWDKHNIGADISVLYFSSLPAIAQKPPKRTLCRGFFGGFFAGKLLVLCWIPACMGP